jgi:hypothetical protein
MDEAAKIPIHDVGGEQDGIEVKSLFAGPVEHAEVNGRVLMAGETDEAKLAGFFGVEKCFEGAARCKETVGIFHADHFVELEQIDMIGLKAPQGFVDLLRGRLFGTAIHFGHEKYFLTIAVAQGFTHFGLGRE